MTVKFVLVPEANLQKQNELKKCMRKLKSTEDIKTIRTVCLNDSE
jgi:hypothetical protein